MLHRWESTNQRFVNLDVSEYEIKVWWDEPDGKTDPWWEITIKKEAIDEFNNGKVKEWADESWELHAKEIKNFCQLDENDLQVLLNYYADTRKHSEWK